MFDLKSVLDKAVGAQSVTGAVAMIGNSDQTLVSAATGRLGIGDSPEMAIDSIFQIASMTKAVTSVAAMQLVERGLLSLDDPIDVVLPDLANPNVVTGFDADGKAQLKPAQHAITLKHLLTHTSGLGYSFTSAEMVKAQGEVVPGSLASISSPLIFEPGTDWLYGVSTDWVGRAVEAASGQTLGDYMEEHILAPLKMKDTGFSVPREKLGRRVSLLARSPDGFIPFPIEIGGGETAEFQSGGGGLYSTAGDYMRFMQMILNQGVLDGARILNAETVAAMSSNQVGDQRAGRMESVVPQFSGVFDTFPDMHTEWGLGFLLNTETGPDGRAPGSLTWAGIANCYYWIDPSNNIAGLVLMQFLPFGDEGALGVVSAVEAAAYKALRH